MLVSLVWTRVKFISIIILAKHERLSKPVEVEESKEVEEIKSKPNEDQKHLWELRRSVDPHLYRNISLEVWEEEKNVRQQQDLDIAVTLQYKNNDRCLVSSSRFMVSVATILVNLKILLCRLTWKQIPQVFVSFSWERF